MDHHQLIARVAALAQAKRLLWHYCRDSRDCLGARGFPDIVIAGRRAFIFAELKTDNDDTTADQDLWAWWLHQPDSSCRYDCQHARYRLWRTADLLDGTIEKELNEIV